MNPYEKTYFGFKKPHLSRADRLAWLKIIGIFVFDAVFFVLLMIKKLLFLIFKILAFIVMLIYRALWRIVTLPLYRLFLNLKRQSKNIISPQANKLIFF